MRNQIDLLRPAAVFASVVQHGSFRAAAKSLNMPAPVVSQLISDLENKLGVQLLNRAARQLTLTDAGQNFFETSSALVNSFREGLGMITPSHLQITGHLRVHIPTLLETGLLAHFLYLFRGAHPDIDLILEFNDDLHGEDSRSDIRLRFAPLDSPLRQARLLIETNSLLVGGARHFSPPLRANEISQLEWIRPPQRGSELIMRNVASGETCLIRPNSHLIVTSMTMVRKLVENGAGLAIFPDFTIQHALENASLTELMPGWISGRRGLFAILSDKTQEAATARRFIEALEQFLKSGEIEPA